MTEPAWHTAEAAAALPPEDKPAAEWTRAELLAFMRANAPAGVDAEALLPIVKRAVADGADPRQLVFTMRGVMAAGVDPAQMLAMSSMGALPAFGAPANGVATGGAGGAGGAAAASATGDADADAAEAAGADTGKSVKQAPQDGASSGASAPTLSGRARAYFSRGRLKKMGIVAIWLCVWEIADHVVDNRLVLAGPVRTVQALVQQVGTPGFWAVCGASFGRIALGFLLSFAAGILLALLAHRFRTFRDFAEPIVSLLRTVPVVTFIILLLIWLGNQWLTVFLAFFIVLPIIYTNMIAGFESVDAQMLEMARVYRLSRWRMFMYVYRPAFMPFLSSACKLSLGMSWKSGIMAEVLATPKPSIGKEMAQARTFLATPDLFAWTVVVMVLSWLFEKMVLWLLKRAARPCGSLLGRGGADDDGAPSDVASTAAGGEGGAQ